MVMTSLGKNTTVVDVNEVHVRSNLKVPTIFKRCEFETAQTKNMCNTFQRAQIGLRFEAWVCWSYCEFGDENKLKVLRLS